MTFSPEQLEKCRRNPKKLALIIDKFTRLIQLEDEKQHKIRQLRWELTRQLHLAMPKFWLEGKTTSQLIAIYDAYYVEYEKVFGKPRPQSCGSKAEDAKVWALWQKRHWEEAQKA